MKALTLKRAPRGALIAVSLALVGCRSTYYPAQFAPKTHEIYVETEEQDGGAARTLVSVVGVRREDEGAPALVETRMRVENVGQIPLYLEQHSLELLSGDFVPFSTAQVSSEDVPRIEPGAAANYDLLFPMPEGRSQAETHFGSLNLRYTLVFDGEPITTGVQFDRDWPRRAYYYDPFYDPYWPTLQFHYGYGRFGYGYGYGCW